MSTVMTQIPDEKLVALADTYHTPLYVFEETVIRSRCRELKTCNLQTMVMGCVGAYSHAMKNEYNSMNLPASVLVSSDDSVKIIERRGTLNDIMQRELEAYNEGR